MTNLRKTTQKTKPLIEEEFEDLDPMTLEALRDESYGEDDNYDREEDMFI